MQGNNIAQPSDRRMLIHALSQRRFPSRKLISNVGCEWFIFAGGLKYSSITSALKTEKLQEFIWKC